MLDEDGEHRIESELLTEYSLQSQLRQLGLVSVALGFHYTQLLHWAPFDPAPVLEGCGLPFHREGLPFSTPPADGEPR